MFHVKQSNETAFIIDLLMFAKSCKALGSISERFFYSDKRITRSIQ